MSGTVITRTELETRIVGLAWKDEAFRQEFLADPRRTIEKYAGQRLPPQLQVFAHQEDATTLHFTIPPAPARLQELSDEDLEKVAGGIDAPDPAVVATLVFITAVATADRVARDHMNPGW